MYWTHIDMNVQIPRYVTSFPCHVHVLFTKSFSFPSSQMTTVTYPQYLMASLLGLLPTQLLNTYMGSTVRNMQEVLADRMNSYIILGLQIVVSIFLMLYILNKARRELAKLTRNMDMESGNPDNR